MKTAAVTGALLLELAATYGLVSGKTTWTVAAILGLAVLGFSGTFTPPKPALVRIRCQRKRS